MLSSRRLFVKKILAGFGGLLFACDKNPVQPEKSVIIKSVTYNSGAADSIVPVGDYATITFSDAVTNMSTETLFIETLAGEKLSGHSVEIINNKQCKLSFPRLIPGNKYSLIVDGVKSADGSLVDGDNNGKAGGKYKAGLIVVPPTSFTNIYNLNELSVTNVLINIKTSNKLNKDTVNTNNVLVIKKETQKRVDIQVYYDSVKLEVQLIIPQLEYGTDYIIRVTEDVKDVWDFSLDGNNDNTPGGVFEYEFRTTANPDTKPPQLVQVNPTAGSIGVDVNVSVFAVFDEALKNDNLTDKIFVTDKNGAKVQGGISYDLNINTLKFIPENLYNFNELYTVHLVDLQDRAGNLFNDGQEYTWTFTTEINPSMHTPEAVKNLETATGSHPGEVDLSWEVPADKTKDGKNESGADLLFDVYRHTSPIVNEGDIKKADIVNENYTPGITTGNIVNYTIMNPENARTYYFAIRVKDKDGNASQFTSSQAVISKGYGMRLKLTDAVLSGKAGVSPENQVWAGIKIFQDNRQLAITDINGAAEFDATSQSGGLNISNDKGAVVETLLPYSMQNENMNNEFVVPLFDKSSFPLSEVIKVLNPLILDLTNPSNFSYVLKWSSVVTEYDASRDQYIIPLRILGLLADNTQETRQHLENIIQWVELASRGKYRLQTLDEATIIDKEIQSEEDEIGYESSFYDGSDAGNKGILWTHSNPEYNRPPHAETNANPHTSAGPHEVTRGVVVTRNDLEPKIVFTELWRAVMNMFGQLESNEWDLTILNDEYDTSQFMTKKGYRGLNDLVYIEEIFTGVQTLPVSTKITQTGINLRAQLLS
ncbi:Ig-like domain-containing protein [candidate division KSB1 bacterium]|nr:Ig-like domain-containing protein [candidate division KSB1 bacterium]